jgi:hypothetical protein
MRLSARVQRELASYGQAYAAKQTAKRQFWNTLKNGMWLLLMAASFVIYYLIIKMQEALSILN